MAAPLTPEAVLKRHPHAIRLSVADGRHALGIVLDARDPRPRSAAAPAYAFDQAGAYVGEFGSRREAVAALPRPVR